MGKEQQLEQEWREHVRDALKQLLNDVTEIKVQTTKTNGRVNMLEEKHKTCPINDYEKQLDEVIREQIEERIPVQTLIKDVIYIDEKIEKIDGRLVKVEDIAKPIIFFKQYPKLSKYILVTLILIILASLGINIGDALKHIKLF